MLYKYSFSNYLSLYPARNSIFFMRSVLEIWNKQEELDKFFSAGIAVKALL